MKNENTENDINFNKKLSATTATITHHVQAIKIHWRDPKNIKATNNQNNNEHIKDNKKKTTVKYKRENFCLGSPKKQLAS